MPVTPVQSGAGGQPRSLGLNFQAGKFSLILLLARKFLLWANEISIKLMSTLQCQQLMSAAGCVFG